MPVLRKRDVLGRYARREVHLFEDHEEIEWSGGRLRKYAKEFDFSKTYDVFLSHAFNDARIVRQIREELIDQGHSVYVDWVEDKQLDRNRVSKYSATVLRNRMKNCSCLIYLTSVSAEKSVWMPWELGYMDAKTNRVAVAPILEDDEDNEEFLGREYLGIYPYLDLSGSSFFIQNSKDSYVSLRRWLKGDNPPD